MTTYDDLTEVFSSYEATRIPRVAETQRISIENTWLAGPTETDWYYCYDACRAPSDSALIFARPSGHEV